VGQVAARVRDGEEMHKLHDILPPRCFEWRDIGERQHGTRKDKSKWPPEYVAGVSDICVVGIIREYRKAM